MTAIGSDRNSQCNSCRARVYMAHLPVFPLRLLFTTYSGITSLIILSWHLIFAALILGFTRASHTDLLIDVTFSCNRPGTCFLPTCFFFFYYIIFTRLFFHSCSSSHFCLSFYCCISIPWISMCFTSSVHPVFIAVIAGCKSVKQIVVFHYALVSMLQSVHLAINHLNITLPLVCFMP